MISSLFCDGENVNARSANQSSGESFHPLATPTFRRRQLEIDAYSSYQYFSYCRVHIWFEVVTTRRLENGGTSSSSDFSRPIFMDDINPG